jgi:hypothetical protein
MDTVGTDEEVSDSLGAVVEGRHDCRAGQCFGVH